MNLEYRLMILANYQNQEVTIAKDVIPYDASNEIWPNKDVMRAHLEIWDGNKKIYDKMTCASSVFMETEEGKLKEFNFSLPRLAISWLKPHIDDGYNPDFIINSILDYTKDKNWAKSYLDLSKFEIA